ncbi:MAG: hypothetical protein HQL41_10345 [Alphaproteobacteria bacterium]|nr:hypothetical protein [Alphaproteobacteria bacterium]
MAEHHPIDRAKARPQGGWTPFPRARLTPANDNRPSAGSLLRRAVGVAVLMALGVMAWTMKFSPP